jgi:hypothetical protein
MPSKDLFKILLALVTCALFIAAFLTYQSYEKYKLQILNYNLAREMSIKKNKKLLVIGNPLESSTNLMFGTYGMGDICIDMNRCQSNEINNNAIIIEGKLEDHLKDFATDSVVIFESETLEYIDSDKIDYVIYEMNRISGGDIFAVHQLKPFNTLTTMKQCGYKTFNYLLGKPVFEYNQLMVSYPSNSDYRYVSMK